MTSAKAYTVTMWQTWQTAKHKDWKFISQRWGLHMVNTCLLLYTSHGPCSSSKHTPHTWPHLKKLWFFF